MDDLNTLKAEIEALPVHEMDTMQGVIDVVDREAVLVLVAPHAAEPAPVAVEGMPDRLFAYSDKEWTFHKGIGRGVEYIRADLAPTGNTALVEELDVEATAENIAKHLSAIENVEGFTGRHHAVTLNVAKVAAEMGIRAALSQPAAPQPTPEVEAWQRVMLVALKLPEETQGKRAVLQAIAKERALARGSVAAAQKEGGE